MKAAEDDDFRAALLADARGAIEQETGLRFPADFQVHVHQESASEAHMVLPPRPELSVEQLDRISGGMGSFGWK